LKLNFFHIFQIFQALEHPFEENKLTDLKVLVESERENFVRFIFNDSWNSVRHRENIDVKLLEYEQANIFYMKARFDVIFINNFKKNRLSLWQPKKE